MSSECYDVGMVCLACGLESCRCTTAYDGSGYSRVKTCLGEQCGFVAKVEAGVNSYAWAKRGLAGLDIGEWKDVPCGCMMVMGDA